MRTALKLLQTIVVLVPVVSTPTTFVVVIVIVLEATCSAGVDSLLLLGLLLHAVRITHVVTITASLVEMIIGWGLYWFWYWLLLWWLFRPR